MTYPTPEEINQIAKEYGLRTSRYSTFTPLTFSGVDKEIQAFFISGIEMGRKMQQGNYENIREWKPIETAPKDRKHILLFGNGSNFSDCIFVGYFSDYVVNQWVGFDGNYNVYHTHWMALPDSPIRNNTGE